MTPNVLDSPALPVLLELEAQGFAIRIAPEGCLEVQPGSRLTPDQQRALRAHKVELVTLLRCCDPGVVARRDLFRTRLETGGQGQLTSLVYVADVPYVVSRCFSCGDDIEAPRYGRCWRCALAWRLACRLPIPADFAAAIDAARRVA